MMYVFIDHDGDQGTVSLRNEDGELAQIVVENKEQLLGHFDTLLQSANLNIGDLDGIVVRLGVGRFSRTRAAVALANTLAFSAGIGVYSISAEEPFPVDLSTLKESKFIQASYSAPPSISTPKKK